MSIRRPFTFRHKSAAYVLLTYVILMADDSSAAAREVAHVPMLRIPSEGSCWL
jgi:hypothetical protein